MSKSKDRLTVKRSHDSRDGRDKRDTEKVLVRLKDGRTFRVAPTKAARFIDRMEGRSRKAERSLCRSHIQTIDRSMT